MFLIEVSTEKASQTRAERAPFNTFCLLDLFLGEARLSRPPDDLGTCLADLITNSLGLAAALSAEQIDDDCPKHQQEALGGGMALLLGNNSTDGCNKPVVMTKPAQHPCALFSGCW